MEHDFSAQFMRVIPPDTDFGAAWESLCFDLLKAEFNDPSIIRFKPPDKGIDILHRNACKAYQCKSDERGSFGSISAEESIQSLKTAFENRNSFSWDIYYFATNAYYTGSSFGKVMQEGNRLGLDKSEIEFYGPDYWDDLCTKHFARVCNRFDYRVSVTEKQVIDSFKRARYFDNYVKEYESLISNSNFYLVIKNNRTPLEIKIPFSPELSVENCLDVTKELLGVSLEWVNFNDLGTSAGPSLSITIDRMAQGFSQKIKDIPLENLDKLQLWITIVWKDKSREEAVDSRDIIHYLEYCRDVPSFDKILRENVSYDDRRQYTLNRTEDILQSAIWTNARKLKSENE
jgi:hypothetical protein